MSQVHAVRRGKPDRQQRIYIPRDQSTHVVRPLPQRVRVEAFGDTDVGFLREANEDSFAVLPPLGLFMVADGMGGANAGEVASRMAIDCVREALENRDGTSPCPSLVAGIHRANSRIVNAAQNRPEWSGMGTTFAGIFIVDDRLVIAHVGDTRVYRLRGRAFDRLTEDHSLVNYSIRMGTLRPEDAGEFPQRNIIMRAVGVDERVEVDTRIDAPQLGDLYLICSDGLHEVVDDRKFPPLLQHPKLSIAVHGLIDLALDAGGPDNITAVLLRVTAVAA